MENPPASPSSAACGISHLGNDLLENIIGKLPAQSFASAACVSRTWNDVCCRILSRPLIASAISLNPSFTEAMKEVVGKVLSGPIRPHFAILCICSTFDLDEAHRLIAQKLGSNTPLITCNAGGVIGREALTDQFNEVMFPYYDEDDEFVNIAEKQGISLTVGYLPGLKVDVIPLSYPIEGHSIDKFVVNIRDFSASASGCTSPQAIFLFGDSQADMKPILEKLDYALSEQTVIAGNESCRFRWARSNSPFNSEFECERVHFYGAVGLVFASDKNTPEGAWKIDFHFAVGTGVTAFGPTYTVVSAKLRGSEFASWLTAKREGENETLDGEQILDDLANNIDMGMGDPIHDYDLYIGVTKRRKYSIGSEKVKAVTSLSYHSVQRGDEQYLYVHGLDIKTRDSFRFYVTDPRFASRQCDLVSENFRRIQHKDVIGSFLFSCCGRGAMFFGEPNVDSLPILNNFPSIPLAGMFCGAEIGRGPSMLAQSGPEQDTGSARTCLHVYSSIYVLISCSQPSCRP
ncbi:hypothetical protein RND81_02G048800 [Saponaria officinalis]|uniref:FIST C-domain domain-containing protein n=1 Tax=Saponaria officinalis TaxID=3572 RepID=A0AAW1MQJ6_SAPOF